MSEDQLLEIEDVLERYGWKYTLACKWHDPVTGNEFDAEAAIRIHVSRLSESLTN